MPFFKIAFQQLQLFIYCSSQNSYPYKIANDVFLFNNYLYNTVFNKILVNQQNITLLPGDQYVSENQTIT